MVWFDAALHANFSHSVHGCLQSGFDAALLANFSYREKLLCWMDFPMFLTVCHVHGWLRSGFLCGSS
jgi:hypothetical protein